MHNSLHVLAPMVFVLSASISGCNCGPDDPNPPGYRERIRPNIVNPEVLAAEPVPAETEPPRIRPVELIPPIVRGPRQTDFFRQEPAIVDVLWIVDNSASLTNERQSLATEFDRFLTILLDADVDYHVGVTSTDLNSPRGDYGRLRGTPPFIDLDTVDPESVFANAVLFPDDLDIRLEEGFHGMRTALSSPLIDEDNAGFLREEASLAVIVVSDEDDSSLGLVDQYVRFLYALKGPGREPNLSVSAVVGPNPDGCVVPGEELIFGAGASAGSRYIEAANLTGGLVESICSADFAPFVEELATRLAGLRRFFPLTAPPGGNLRVFVDGALVPRDALNGWTLDTERMGIVFEGNYVPPPGSEVRIEYDVAL